MTQHSSSINATQLHILVFAKHTQWTRWLQQIDRSHPYRLLVDEVSSPKEAFLRLVSHLPHLLLIDLDCPPNEVQQVLGFAERTCPFVPTVGLYTCTHLELSEWQRNVLPGIVSQHHPEQLGEYLDWALSVKLDSADPGRRMRIMQQIEQNLRALEEMDSFFEEGSNLPDSFSQQTRQEIAQSRRYLEMLRDKLREEGKG